MHYSERGGNACHVEFAPSREHDPTRADQCLGEHIGFRSDCIVAARLRRRAQAGIYHLVSVSAPRRRRLANDSRRARKCRCPDHSQPSARVCVRVSGFVAERVW